MQFTITVQAELTNSESIVQTLTVNADTEQHAIQACLAKIEHKFKLDVVEHEVLVIDIDRDQRH